LIGELFLETTLLSKHDSKSTILPATPLSVFAIKARPTTTSKLMNIRLHPESGD
jgi:hypothetical protein